MKVEVKQTSTLCVTEVKSGVGGMEDIVTSPLGKQSCL
jgi:hypothetical protein